MGDVRWCSLWFGRGGERRGGGGGGGGFTLDALWLPVVQAGVLVSYIRFKD